MFANVRLKKALKNTIFPIFTLVNKFISKRDDIILLYSGNKGINNCLLPLRKYLLDNGYDKKYKIYCGIEGMEYADDEPRVKFITQIQSICLYLKTKHVFYTTGQIPIKPSKSQCVIQLWHGNSNFKTIGKWTNINNGDEFFFTYMFAPSELYIPIQASEYGCSESCIVPYGDMFVDEMLEAPRERTLFKEFDKVLFWAPTFRKSDYLGYDDSEMENLVPMFDEKDYPMLNEELKRRNIKLIVKPHPMHKNIGVLPRHFSHLDVYTHEEFLEAGLQLYPMLAQVDGLIGDYSSVSMQFMLLDRPMAFVVPDIEEYGKRRGFVFKNPEDYMGGHIIKTQGQFLKFLDDFAQGKDVYREKRRYVCDKVYKYKDAGTRRRAVELSGLHL
jgi:CDP-glycerol glycerophosphotransferase (TagB/SpsB family)